MTIDKKLVKNFGPEFYWPESKPVKPAKWYKNIAWWVWPIIGVGVGVGMLLFFVAILSYRAGRVDQATVHYERMKRNCTESVIGSPKYPAGRRMMVCPLES